MTTDPRDALIVGDDSDLSEPTRAWLATLPLQNTPADVFARYVRSTAIEDDREDRERERRRAASLAEREDAAAVAWVRGDAAETVSVAERFAQWAAMDEIESRNDNLAAARRSQQRAEERAVLAERRRLELEAELAKERAAHQRASWMAEDRLAGWQAARARAEQGYYSQPQSHYRVRNYWE